MPRRVTPSQLRSMIRQGEVKQRQAVRRYNAEARKHNASVKRAVDEHNANVRRARREVNEYNRKARAHNARVRADRRRLQTELARLERQRSATRYVSAQSSTAALHTAFRRVDLAAESELWGAEGNALVDLAEAETANSAAATNALLAPAADAVPPSEGTVLTDELLVLSEDLHQRWQGALFSINERNPDAARHFCTSSREIITKVIDLNAPNQAVLAALPKCRRTENGSPIRREKITYLLGRSDANYASLGDFIDTDVDDVLQLFRVFNDSAHGRAGALDLAALRALKGRVEGAIRFLSAVVRGI